MPRSKTARKAKAKVKAKAKIIKLEISASLIADVDEVAKSKAMTRSAFIRHCIMRGSAHVRSGYWRTRNGYFCNGFYHAN